MKKQTLNMIVKVIYASCLLGVTHSTLANATDANIVSSLIEQANYWHGKAHDERAIEALQKVLIMENNNQDALYLMAFFTAQQGNEKQASYWREKLARIAPQDPRIAGLKNIRSSQFSEQQLGYARELAQKGQHEEAIKAYQRLFVTHEPPDTLSLEYYQTMAGIPAMLPQAIAGLKQRAQRMPDNKETQKALGLTLTYNEETRREGIAILSKISGDETAKNGLRQALLWLNVRPDDEGLYQSYLQTNPNDKAIAQHYQGAIQGNARQAGYEALNTGNLKQATTYFKQALTVDSQDAQALAGLGYVALRSGDLATGQKLLNQASQSGGEQGQKWKQQAEDAGFYSQLREVQRQAKQGNTQQALDKLLPLTHSSGEKGLSAHLLQADLLRKQGNLPAAYQLLSELYQQHSQNEKVISAYYYLLIQQGKNSQAEQLVAKQPASLRQKLTANTDPSERLRRDAQKALENGHRTQARQLLTQAQRKNPQNNWVYLDLARLMIAEGDKTQADQLILQLERRQTRDANYIAALFYVEQKQWDKVFSLLNSQPQQNEAEKALLERARFYRQLTQAERYYKTGNLVAMRNTLRPLINQVADYPNDVGELAEKLVNSGAQDEALQLIENDLAKGTKGSVGNYAGHINVFNALGRYAQASSLINDPALQQQTPAAEKQRLAILTNVAQADSLREKGEIKAAYQTLVTSLKVSPDDPDLLMALSRVYLAQSMPEQSNKILSYLEKQQGRDSKLLQAQIEVALAQKDGRKAKTLLQQIPTSSQPAYLLQAAQVAQLNGENRQALALLRSAQWQTTNNTTGTVNTAAGQLMALESENSVMTGSINEDKQMVAVQRSIRQLEQQISPWVQGGIAIRHRNGDKGLSNLTEISAPIAISSVPGEDWRWQFNINPVSITSGTASGERANRFGSGQLQHAERFAKNSDNHDEKNKINADDAGSQRASGVELGLVLSDHNTRFDVGTTPLNKDSSTIVGGLTYSPKIGQNGQLTLTAERRAIKDSLLSYMGRTDPITGETWGQVTRNGAKAQYAWDDGKVGAYIGGGYYNYQGKSVESNEEVKVWLGSYANFYKDEQQEVKAGVHVDYMNFKNNQNYFSLGHGGYFSPQDYVAVSLPVAYTRRFEKGEVSLNGAIGVQSYKQKGSDYFPTHAYMQNALNKRHTSDSRIKSRYEEQDETNITYRLGLDAKYYLNKESELGLSLSHDTSGDYAEDNMWLYLKYTPDFLSK
ncbi:BCSC C-terminal domain-containing protein [Proteus mirabilis]|uniref:cellulose biosynthesis protein BcsC n=1 Tax=Proteus TaxID=583 RepID=UPI001378D923|nr:MULTISPECIES: cellulose biosynthesis protein BcsC [Proteus]ELA8071444.1 BCSC C-terminal domain-containing protein [Proteus mirabilis]ELJ9402004.1 BCSC C-terminal domain-containing protein [Proteus mirabilis]ELJ9435268.1 BCSC C-terminal domain-containing protein [Proteus mirabilis]ELS1786454.1 BCSC C-terminal domain-containing protein [Proteus mirabilis]ELS1789662.1 BCSC C-terminal domain-containing protein [Proteus mirabilis]